MYLLSTPQVFSLVGLTQSHCGVPVTSLGAVFIFSVSTEQKLSPVLPLVPCNHFYYTLSPKLDCSDILYKWNLLLSDLLWVDSPPPFGIMPSQFIQVVAYMGMYSFLPMSNISWCASATSFLPLAL